METSDPLRHPPFTAADIESDPQPEDFTMTKTEQTALSIMGHALSTLTVQMQQDRYAKDRVVELKDAVKLLMTGVQALVSEAEGDPEYINVKAILDDIDTAMADIIEIEEGEVPATNHRQQYGTYHARGGRVA